MNCQLTETLSDIVGQHLNTLLTHFKEIFL